MKRLFGKKTPQALGQVIQPIFNETGVLLCSLRADGGMNMEQVDVPVSWKTTDGNGRQQLWYVGQPISLELSDDAIVMRKSGDQVRVFDSKGDAEQTTALLVSMRQRWFEANSEMLAGQTISAGAPKPVQSTQGGRTPWARRLAYTSSFVGVFAAGLGGMYYYLHPGGVGLDLTGMSIDDVAKIDSNPAMIRDVQDQMMAAVGIGQENAKKISGKIEQDHIAALKAMGLNTGVSMNNALTCLAQ